jgi:hypothetical protein
MTKSRDAYPFDLETPIANVTTLAGMLNGVLDGAVNPKYSRHRQDVGALYYLVDCLSREAKMLNAIFYGKGDKK